MPITPYYGAGPVAQDQIAFANTGSMIFTENGNRFTGYIPDDTIAELLQYSEPAFHSDRVKSRVMVDGGINDFMPKRQKDWPAIGHFSTPYLSRRTRTLVQGRPFPNPFRGQY